MALAIAFAGKNCIANNGEQPSKLQRSCKEKITAIAQTKSLNSLSCGNLWKRNVGTQITNRLIIIILHPYFTN